MATNPLRRVFSFMVKKYLQDSYESIIVISTAAITQPSTTNQEFIMKKLIIASVLAAASFGANASSTIKVCDAALTSFYGSKITDYQHEAAIVSDNGGQFSVLLVGSDDVLVSPELTQDADVGFLSTSKGVTFLKLKDGKGYSAGMEDKDIRINFVNCKSGRGV